MLVLLSSLTLAIRLPTNTPIQRCSLLVTGSPALLDNLPTLCRSSVDADADATGVIYRLPTSARLEVIAEGERTTLDLLATAVEAEVAAQGADCSVRVAWQPPTYAYTTKFPVVDLATQMKAKVEISGDEATVDYYRRSVQLEAVFNRGLKMQKRGSKGKLTLELAGDADRLKQFLRWCYRGPPLLGTRADVFVKWSK